MRKDDFAELIEIFNELVPYEDREVQEHCANAFEAAVNRIIKNEKLKNEKVLNDFIEAERAFRSVESIALEWLPDALGFEDADDSADEVSRAGAAFEVAALRIKRELED